MIEMERMELARPRVLCHFIAMQQTQQKTDDLKLHIGGQEQRDGWVILDANPGPIVDYVGNCTDLSMFADNSCSEVYASHVFEHLGYDGDLQKAIEGVYRILKPGGRLCVAVPDLEILCRMYLAPQSNPEARFKIMRMMFGGRVDAHDIHYTGFDVTFLGSYLHTAGFKDIERVRSFDIGFKDTSELTYGGLPISLNLTARK